MRFLLKLFWWLLVFSVGVIAGFMLFPAKRGYGNTVNYNFSEDELEEEAL